MYRPAPTKTPTVKARSKWSPRETVQESDRAQTDRRILRAPTLYLKSHSSTFQDAFLSFSSTLVLRQTAYVYTAHSVATLLGSLVQFSTTQLILFLYLGREIFSQKVIMKVMQCKKFQALRSKSKHQDTTSKCFQVCPAPI